MQRNTDRLELRDDQEEKIVISDWGSWKDRIFGRPVVTHGKRADQGQRGRKVAPHLVRNQDRGVFVIVGKRMEHDPNGEAEEKRNECRLPEIDVFQIDLHD